MQFPYAYKGVSKLVVAQILELVIAALTVGILILILKINSDSVTAQVLLGGFTLFGILLIRLVILFLRMIGLLQARKDEKGFFKAFFLTFAALVLSFIKLVSGDSYGRIEGWIGIGETLCHMIAIELILISIHTLGKKLNHPPVVFAASKMQLVMVILYVVIILIQIYRNTPNMSEEISSILGSLLELVVNILLVIFLGKAKKMLAQRENAGEST